MNWGRFFLSSIFAMGVGFAATNARAATCTYERAHYAYTGNSAITATFVKLPANVDYLGDLGMNLEIGGRRLYSFVFDAGSRFTVVMMSVPPSGPEAWRIVEGMPGTGGLQPMDFYQWSGDKLFGGVPKTGDEAPKVLFIPALDESLRHPPSDLLRMPPGFFKFSRCG